MNIVSFRLLESFKASKANPKDLHGRVAFDFRQDLSSVPVPDTRTTRPSESDLVVHPEAITSITADKKRVCIVRNESN